MDPQIPGTVCSYLGLFDDRSLVRSLPTQSHRCYRLSSVTTPDLEHQAQYCLSGAFASCSVYQAGGPASAPSSSAAYEESEGGLGGWWAVYLGGGLLAVVLAVVSFYVWDWLNVPAAAPMPRPEGSRIAVAVTSTVTPSPTETELLLTDTPAPASVAMGVVTPTPVPGGRALALRPSPGDVGWWTGESGRRGNIGDSFLYVGTREGQDYLSAMRFDLRRIARGADIVEANLVLTGLRDERAQADPNAAWVVQLIPDSALPQFYRADYQTLISAPAPITLPPVLAADLSLDTPTVLMLDDTTRQWLKERLIDGETGVIVRIRAWTDGAEDLFAWDSGTGPATSGFGPAFILNVGPPPPTPPPTPTRPFIVATLTPEPKNMMTAVALAAAATEVATTVGTYTPAPYAIQTPTPYPANLATQQAIAVENGWPPIMLPSPSPATAAEATELALYPTLVALTTGTFTPTPIEYVTPIVILPSPPAANLATEAARSLEVTAWANDASLSTATPLPYNAVVAVYVFATPTPENAATTAAQAPIATAQAIVKGTPTSLPWYAVVITASPTPSPTEVPLLVDSMVTPTPTATEPPDTLPDGVRGKILFKSSRGGDATFMLDPETGDVELVTQGWVYPLAREQLTLSPDGSNLVYVKEDGSSSQLFVDELEYDRTQQITRMPGLNYDPAWAPDSDRIAFVSTDPGNDEIYVVRWENGEPVRLTINTWEWDKHPTWSPDGSQIVFFSNRETGRCQLWIMNADGSDPRNLSNDEFEDWDPVWVR